jgi:hypothetical protein
MNYFSESEFRGWFRHLHKDMLPMLNKLRHEWGHPIIISPAGGSVGRRDSTKSRHNVNYWGSVKAVDIFPRGVDYDHAKALEFFQLARKVGFNGIGVYPTYYPSIMFHVDIRTTAIDWVDTGKYPAHNYVYYYVEQYLKEQINKEKDNG